MSIHDPKEFLTRWVNLADPRLGAQALAASDEFFAAKERMLEPQPAVFVPGKYDTNGKWMDGWESRRKRVAGHDWCIVKLGLAGVLKGVDIDTSHFTGNFPPAASIEACAGTLDAGTAWHMLVPPTNLRGNSHHYIEVESGAVWTHLRLNIYPDGGVARLRVYGQPLADWSQRSVETAYDLIAVENGGRIVACNDAHFGAPQNLLMPGRGVNMGDGWETRRRREPGNDWVVIELGHPGHIAEVIVDTAHFKGNYPDRCSIQAAHVGPSTDQALITRSMFWETLLPEQKLGMDQVHRYAEEILAHGPITHIKLNIIPDGGVSRLRLIGTLAR